MTTLIGENSTGWSKRARGSTRPALSPSRALKAVWALQRDRWILWLPPAMIAGSAAWMLAPTDPPIWLGGTAFVLGIVASVMLAAMPHATPTGWQVRLRQAVGGLCALAAAGGLGAIAAQVRTQSVAQPAFAASDEPRAVEGWVIANDANDNGPRLRLLVRSIDGVDAPPRYARMSVSEAGLLTPGRAARCFGVLGPPSGPMAPGAYDFARRAYFERLGATGFSFGRCRPADFEPPASWFDRQRLQLAAMRADLSAEIQSLVPGRGGSIAAALISGDRSAVDRDTNEMLFNAGLGHLLSVSGIHDLIAAIGQTFGERPEAVQAVPKPPDEAFILCVAALLCACLWRGALRWLGAPILAASIAVYVSAPQPIAAFDSDLRAIYVRDANHWTLLTHSRRSTYARDRLGATLGLSPAEIERLAPAEACTDSFCLWQTQSRPVIMVRDASLLERACVPRAIVIAQIQTPEDFATRCQLAAVVTSESIAQLGGAIITETPFGPRIERAWPADIRRPWTPQTRTAEGE